MTGIVAVQRPTSVPSHTRSCMMSRQNEMVPALRQQPGTVDNTCERGAVMADRTCSFAAREWAVTEGRSMRIVLCGYDDEHEALTSEGWTVIDGKSGRGAGYSARPDNGRRERLWLSPTCITDGVQDRLDFGAVS